MNKNRYLEKLLNGEKVEWKALGEICEIKTGKLNANASVENGEFQFFTCSDKVSFIDHFAFDMEAILIAGNGDIGNVKYYKGKFNAYQRTYVLGNFKLNAKYLFHFLKGNLKNYLLQKSQSGTLPYITLPTLKDFQIPIPPLHIQQKIVDILDKFCKLKTALKTERELRLKQYAYYRDKLLTFGEDVPMVALGDMFDILAGGDVPKNALSPVETEEFKIPVLSNGTEAKSLYGWTNIAKITKPSLTVSARGTIGWTSYQETPFYPIVRLLVLTPKIDIHLKYAFYFMKMIENDYKVPTTGIPQLTKPMIRDLKIPIPPLETQQKIVEILDKLDTYCHSLTEGLPKEMELREKQYQYYRDLLLDFPKN